MTVCHFFLQGICHFGRNCRFEHSYNNDDRSNRNHISSQQLSNVVNQIVEEVKLAEKGGQWPLSCFSPIKEAPNIPGWEDYSPEEVRWKMYEARANGTLNQCTLEINQLYSNAEKMRNILKEPTMERVNLIVNLLKGIRDPSNSSSRFTTSSSSGSNFGGSNQSADTQKIFRSASSNTGNIFGGSSSTSGNVFGGSSQSGGNIFGGSSSFSPNQNIFGGSNSSNAFSQNAFSNSQTTNQNIFSNSSSVGSGNIFSNTTVSSQNIFSKPGEGISNAFLPSGSSSAFTNQASSGTIFGSNATFFQNAENQKQNSSNIFGGQSENIFKSQNAFIKSSNVFNTQAEANKSVFGGSTDGVSFNSNLQTSKEFDVTVYSKLEELNEEEIKSFTSPTFAFGKIPLKPPPKEYCK